MAITTLCARCGINEVPVPESVEEDPICENCKREMYPSCPGWRVEDCGNPKLEGGDLCGDCHGARLDFESPRVGQPRLNYDFGSGGHEYYC